MNEPTKLSPEGQQRVERALARYAELVGPQAFAPVEAFVIEVASLVGELEQAKAALVRLTEAAAPLARMLGEMLRAHPKAEKLNVTISRSTARALAEEGEAQR